ncbi:hypothetical protein [Flavobacterium chungbukense]|uniref:Lipoprotein n=1 Tax=Flavobacterium chungbukense TaxID=877464 RepID=A0ABP7YN36_9FLAO|nr:hypothetical protein [Flavobacterium chungbukense]MCC4919799.1 hypothetical protein [Flavobacterium chungbukense]
MAFTSLFSVFSCTSDESEIQTTKKKEIKIEKLQADGGPGDDMGDTKPPVKPPTK